MYGRENLVKFPPHHRNNAAGNVKAKEINCNNKRYLS